jgi:uncharacterized protein YaaR (DUF327 family)
MSLTAISNAYHSALNTFSRPSLDDTAITQKGSATKLDLVQETKPNFLEKFDKFLTVTKKERPSLEDMQGRLADIKYRGKMLLNHPIESSVKSYMKDIKDFLSDVRDHAYESKYRDSLFQKINVVDSKLEKVGDELLDGQTNELALLDSLGHLQGLLVDIYV